MTSLIPATMAQQSTSRERPNWIHELRRGRQMFLEELDRSLSAVLRHCAIVDNGHRGKSR